MEILIVVLLIVLNGVFSLSEIAVVSSRKAVLQQRANAGDAKARAALELANSPNRFLSTVQIGITLIGILTGAFGGITTAEQIEERLNQIPALAPYSEGIALAAVVTVITYLSLVIGELVPKRLGMRNPEGVASTIAAPMRLLSKAVSPVVSLLSFSTDGILRLMGIRSSESPEVTEEEIKALIQQGAHAGILDQSEHSMVQGVFGLGDQRIGTLMTPRTEMVWLEINDSQADIFRKIAESGYSSFPVCKETPDHILGIVDAKALLLQSLQGQALDFTTVLDKPLFVPESVPATQALELFRRNGVQIGLVINEYGGIEGLVTLADIISEIVGHMGPEIAHATQRDDGSWLLDGLMLVDEFKELFNIKALPEEDEGDYYTLGGFVMTQQGRVPAVADQFEWNGLRFEVVDMDGNRVDKVLVEQLPAKDAALSDET
ncbi:MAG: HlyC/CorC family transporter [Burkholderiales bacterium]|nr:HlyC/CorC family transporter [Anaerolineae bacterium]